MTLIKILWHSVAPWVPTGYGNQTGLFTKRIRDLGHDVAISSYYGIFGAKQLWHGMTVYPAYAESYGRDMLIPHAVDHFGGGGPGASLRDIANRGLIITLGDVWCFQVPLLADMCAAAWAPVDHETVPPMVADWFTQTGAVPIAMSRFGEAKLTELGLSPLYVPHGYDPDVFGPGDKAEARARVGLPADAFVLAMVAANVGKDGSRKAFYEQILAFGELRRRHSDAVLVLHTDVTTPLGVDIRALLADFPEHSYMVTDQYAYKVGLPASAVADLFRAADVLTSTSWGEGFGVPIIEAQATGCPVVVTDTTAMPELVGAGWKVPGEPLWHDSQRAWARRPLIGAIIDAYVEAYDKARDESMRAEAWAFAQDYQADRVAAKYWVPALKQLEDALQRRREEATHPVPARPRVREADGLLWLDRGTQTGDTLGFADHEVELKPIVAAAFPDGGVLLDVGAHVGHWSLRLAARAEHVYAVEANPASAATLRRNLALNDITNVTVLEVAAWDEETFLMLDDPGRQVAGGSTRTIPIGEPDGGEHTAVPARPLDNVPELTAAQRIDLVKMDVEGADLHALRGMSALLAKHRPTLFIECHDYCGYYTRAELEALLAGLGYTFEVAHTYQTRWQPGGGPHGEWSIADEERSADYLLCVPVG